MGMVLAALVASAPAWADDYVLAARYAKPEVGEAAFLVDSQSVRKAEDGNMRGDVVSLDAGGQTVTVYTTEMNCAAGSWAVVYQTAYETDNLMAPAGKAFVDPAFHAAAGDARPAFDLLCGWPEKAKGLERIAAADPIALSRVLSPKLKFAPKPSGGD